jgi:hypothetical protein
MFASVLALGVLTASYGAAAGAAASLQGLTWSALSPPESPPGLVGAVAAYDSTNSTIVLFGGHLANGQLSARTWVWDGSTWSPAAAFGASPAPRELASMAFDTALDPPQLILFGGRGDDGALLDDTWTWNGSSWNQLATTSAPGGREGAAMTADAAGQVVLFGGYGRTTPAPPAPTAPTTPTTPTPPTSTTTTTVPSPSTTTVPTSSTTSSVPTTTTVPASTTTTATTTTTTPPPDTTAPTTSVTSVPAATTPGGAALTADIAPPQVLDDTWVLTRSDQWVQAPTPVHPPPTTDASMATGGSGQIMMFGGSGRAPGDAQTAGTTAQTWLYLGGTWSKVKMATAPSARQDASLAYDAGLGQTVLFGGVGPAGPLGDTWVWNGATWQPVTPASAPAARWGATAAYDAASQHLVEFGGADGAGGALSSTEVLGAYAPIVASGSTTTSSSPSSTGSTSVGPTTTVGDSSAFGSGSVATTAKTTPTTVAHPARLAVHRGDVVTLSGFGFMPGALVTITFHSVAQVVASAVANAAGDFTTNVEVPTRAAAGHHHFEASGLAPGGGMTEQTKQVDVIGVAAVEHTAGRTKLILVGIALAIPVLSWAALDVAARRRVTPRP